MKEVVLQHKEERDILRAKPYLDRNIAVDKGAYLNSGLIKLITGPRRAGKSVIAFQLLSQNDFAYLNFDDNRLVEAFNEDLILQSLYEVYSGFQFLLLDEIQNLPSWEAWVGKLYRRGINMVITGSNAKLLSREMATLLTGRYIQIEVLPFSFYEMLNYRLTEVSVETPAQKAVLLQTLEDYMTYGGYPEIINTRTIAINYLGSLFDSVLLKDITKRFNVRSVTELYNLSNYLLANYANLFTVSQLAEELGIGSKTTVQKFCNYLDETYLFFYLPRFNNKLKLMQKAPQKSYIVDNGFIASRSFELSPNKGRLLENMVFVELVRRGYKAGHSLFYYRTRNDKEIDFVCKSGYKVTLLIQVAYDVTTPKTLKREVSAIEEASQELKCAEGIVITYNEEQTISDSIHVVPVWKWLAGNYSQTGLICEM